MSSDLRDRLDDLLADVPPYVVPDGRSAWRTGRRRRTRRRVIAAASGLGVLALFAGLVTAGIHVTGAQPARDGGSRSALSHPVRIEHPLLRTGTLPDDVGAIAGAVQRPDGWYAVGQHGQLWRIQGATNIHDLPSVSPDGSRLAHMHTRGDARQLILTDLRAGTVETRPLPDPGPLFTSSLPLNTQTFWSPDSSRLLVPVVIPGVGQGEPDAVVIRVHGGTRPVVVPHSRHLLAAGWFDDDTLVWLTGTRGHTGLPVASATALLTNLSGHVERRIPLRMKGVWTDPPTSTSVSVAPGGDVLALGTDQGPALSVWWFWLDGPLRGHVKAELDPSPYTKPEGCPASWSDTIQLPGAGYPDTILSPAGGGSTIYADPRLHISCSVWASDALTGTAYEGLTARVFDDSGRLRLGSTSWLSWHWRETLFLGGLGLVLVAGGVVWRRRRKPA